MHIHHVAMHEANPGSKAVHRYTEAKARKKTTFLGRNVVFFPF
ncbi:hypothetical protein [Bacillus massilinigeriensis]|nr:hypothetical protein [Bacillus massilionigeriensis]